MSRLGKKPIELPSGVTASINAGSCLVEIKSSKGALSLQHHHEIQVSLDEAGKIISCVPKEGRESVRTVRAQWGTTRSNIQNMVTGLSKGFEKRLKIVGVGWGAKAKGKGITLAIGFCHPVDLNPPDGVEVVVDNPNLLIIKGPDLQKVGQFAAEIRAVRPPEPYKGKGIMYEGEHIIRKQGKVFGA